LKSISTRLALERRKQGAAVFNASPARTCRAKETAVADRRISSEKTSDLTLGSPLVGLSDFAKDIWQAERLPYNQKSQ